MGFTYKKLWHLLIEKDMNKGDLRRVAGISAASVSKLTKGENLQTEVLAKICAALNCSPSDIMDYDNNTVSETPPKNGDK